jgi:hypothetical protein
LVDDDLADFATCEVSLEETTRRVYVAGSGSGVIVIAEIPDINPDVARRVRDAGCTV